MITPITDKSPICFGVCCPRHAECRRYLAVDGASDSVQRIGTCDDDGKGGMPLFIRAAEIKKEAPT